MQQPFKLIRSRCRGLVLLAFLALSNTVLADEVLQQAQMLIQQGKNQAAFKLLAPLEADRAGQPGYDLLLGISAVESGQSTRGVFALERVLAQEPKNARARAEIARAYLALGETDTARAEFDSLKQQGVPDEVARTIDHYLDAVDRIEYTTRTTLRGYFEGTLGRDTNVNVGPNRNAVAIPGFGGLPFTLGKNSRANSDEFLTLGGGLNLRHPLTPSLALTAGANAWQKINADKSEFDTSNVDGNIGLMHSQDKDVLSLTAQYNQFWVDGEGFRSAAGLTGQWQHNLNSRDQLTAYVQYSDLDYTHQPVRDADRWVVGGAYAHALQTGEVLYAGLYGVKEKEKENGVPFLGFDGYGFRVGAQTSASSDLMYFGSFSLEHRRYGGEDPAFLKKRSDNQYDLNLGATYRVSREWSLTPRLSLTKNSSNVDLNDYHREILSVTLRRDF